MLLIKNGRVLDPASKTDASQDLLLDGEKIVEVASPGKIARARDAEIFDAAGLIIAPGFIDTEMTRATARRQGHDPYLVTSGAERRPLVVFPSEKPVRSCLDVAEQLDVGSHSSKNAEDRLQKEGRLDQLLVQKIGQVVKMP